MHMKRAGLVVVFLISSAAFSFSQDEGDAVDHWSAVRGLEGTWEGEGKGFGQTTKLTHEWEFVLDDRFLRLETRSVSQSSSGDPEIHEDVGYVSWSEGEGLLRFRQFLSEGFVNTFRVDELASPERGLNFEPEGTEGMDALSARMTLRFIDPETYVMILELGPKDGELKPCQTMKLTRMR